MVLHDCNLPLDLLLTSYDTTRRISDVYNQEFMYLQLQAPVALFVLWLPTVLCVGAFHCTYNINVHLVILAIQARTTRVRPARTLLELAIRHMQYCNLETCDSGLG